MTCQSPAPCDAAGTLPPSRGRHERFRARSPRDLFDLARALEVELPWSDDLSILARPLDVAGLRLPNRMVAQPMEGFDSLPDGSPGDSAFRRYRRYAAGGNGLVWVEATAVDPSGQSSSRQFRLHEDNVDRFAALADAIREAARARGFPTPIVAIQLTHSGRYAKPGDVPAPLVARHYPPMDAKQGLAPDHPLVEDEVLDRLPDAFARTAKLARRAGFDAIDAKACHGYLLAELLSAHTRPGRYGGSFENRSRLYLSMVEAVRAAVPGMPLFARFGLADMIPYPYGFGVAREDARILDSEESFRLMTLLRARGISLFNLTIGNPYWNSFYGRPFDIPLPGQPTPPEHPLVGVARCLAATRMAQAAFPDTPMVLFGCGWLRHYFAPVAAGFLSGGGAMLAGQGRGMFAYPDWAADVLAGQGMHPRKCCVTCSICVQLKGRGKDVGCAVRDREVYRL